MITPQRGRRRRGDALQDHGHHRTARCSRTTARRRSPTATFITFAQGNAGLKFTPARQLLRHGQLQRAGVAEQHRRRAWAAAWCSATITVNAAAVCSLIVTSTLDSGVGSLREAINCANATANIDRDGLAGVDPDPITFAIPGSGQKTITPASALPTITDPVTIDGYTQPGASPNTNSLALGAGALGSNAVLLIELDGSQLSSPLDDGLRIEAGSSTVRGLVINRFPANGIELSIGDGNVIEGNLLGTDPGGTLDRGNAQAGVEVLGGSGNNRIGGTSAAARNVIAGNTGPQIRILPFTADLANVIQGNFIGTTCAGTGIVTPSNASTGIEMNGGAPGLTIADNLISGNNRGIRLQNGTGVMIQGNFIGTTLTALPCLATLTTASAVPPRAARLAERRRLSETSFPATSTESPWSATASPCRATTLAPTSRALWT